MRLEVNDEVRSLKQGLEGALRILKPGGRLGLILVAQSESTFNLLYKFCTFVAPAFWGRQVSSVMPDLLRSRDFEIEAATKVRQLYFHSRVLIARKVA